MDKRKAIYVALTTINAQANGWTCIAAGYDEQKVEDVAHSMITGNDIYAQTERKNLVVVSRSRAKRYGFDWNNFDADSYDWYQWIE